MATLLKDLPKNKSKWKHTNGNIYTVLFLSNVMTSRKEYPVTVVYQGENLNIWSRPLSSWHRSMTEVE